MQTIFSQHLRGYFLGLIQIHIHGESSGMHGIGMIRRQGQMRFFLMCPSLFSLGSESIGYY